LGSGFGLVGDGIPIVLLCAADWVSRRGFAVDNFLKVVGGLVNIRMYKESSVVDHFVGNLLGVIDADMETVIAPT